MYRTEIWTPGLPPDQTDASNEVFFIDNGNDEASWIVVENHMSMPIGVGSVNRNSNNKLSLLQQVPGLYKACLPIDPNGDVELSIGIQPNWAYNYNQFTVLFNGALEWSGNRSVLYTTMPEGSMGQWPLYPIESCLPISRGGTPAAGAGNLYVAGPTNIPNAGQPPLQLIQNVVSGGTMKSYKAGIVQEACIMYMQVTITSLGASSQPHDLVASLVLGADQTHGSDTSFANDLTLFGMAPAGATNAIAASAILPCMGSPAVFIFNRGATSAIGYRVTFWLGMPVVPIA